MTEKDAVVLTDFVNSTGDPVFDRTLRQGLAVQPEQSPFLSLVSYQRIQRTFRLMNHPAETRVTGKIAQEVCETYRKLCAFGRFHRQPWLAVCPRSAAGSSGASAGSDG